MKNKIMNDAKNAAIKAVKRNPALFCLGLIFLMYFLPTLFQIQIDNQMHIKGFYIGLPGVLSGDEPHYLVTTTSLINDHDFYIDNNYDNAYYLGGCDAGHHYLNNTGPFVDRHIKLLNPLTKDVVLIDPATRQNISICEGKLSTMYRSCANATYRQIPHTPIGLPIFSAIFLWPLKGTCLIESGAIYLGVLLSFIGIILFYLICLYHLNEYYIKAKEKKNKAIKSLSGIRLKYTALAFTAIFALGTQYWNYSKTYYP